MQEQTAEWGQPCCLGDHRVNSASIFLPLGLSFLVCKVGNIIPA